MTKVALITGTSGGIGGAVARRLARRGYSLFLAYGKRQAQAESTADACRAIGCAVEIRSVDLTNTAESEALVAGCLQRFERLDVLVHAAGRAQESLLATTDDAMVQELVSLHVSSTIALTRSALKPMILNRFGRLVLMSSVSAHKPSQGCAVYAGCKGFVESFVRAMAVEVGRKGITVNAVAPGMVDTEMIEAARSLVGPELAKRSALKRMASPEEIASAVEFLCSDDSSYVNGHVLAVDGAYLGPP